MPKHDPSEKTKSEILETAKRLFLERGFENVNIEDIVKEIGVTRGAFYHYFRSREALIYAVIDGMFFEENPFEIALRQPGLNALEKLQFTFKLRPPTSPVVSEARAFQKVMADPLIFKSEIFSQVSTVAPYVEKLLLAGNEDGSLSVKYPKQTAEILSLLSSIWLSPAVFQVPWEEFIEKVNFFDHLTAQLGVPILDDESKTLILKRHDLYSRPDV